MKYKKSTISIDDRNVSYLSTPGGTDVRTVVFIHGFPFHKYSWTEQLEALPSGIQGIAYDVRGFGESDAGHGFFSVDLFARDLHSFIAALGLRNVVLCGISMGGYIALRAIEQNAAPIAGLILCDTTSRPDTDEAKLARFAGIESIVAGEKEAYADKSIERLFAPANGSRPELTGPVRKMIIDTPDNVISSTLLALASRTDTTPLLDRLAIPVLIIHGEEDAIIRPEQAEALHKSIKGSALKRISGAGHLPPIEQPGVVNRVIAEFLEGI